MAMNPNSIPTKGIIGTMLFLFIIFSVAAVMVPEAQNSGDSIGQESQCNADSVCLFNSSVSATIPCRDNTNQSNVCTNGQHDIPLNGLFSGSGVVFVILMVSLFLLVIRRSNK